MITAKEAKEQLYQEKINLISKRIKQAIANKTNVARVKVEELHVDSSGLGTIINILRENGYAVYIINTSDASILDINWV